MKLLPTLFLATATATAPAPSCAKRLSFTNFGEGDSDLNGIWRHVIIDGKVQENEGFPYYQQEESKLVMWWMFHGDVGHWVVNVTPGKHGNDRLKSVFGDFGCPEDKKSWEGPAAIHPAFSIGVAPEEKAPIGICTTASGMRYWNVGYIDTSPIPNGNTKDVTFEECMDLCLERSDCFVVAYHKNKNICYLKGHSGDNTVVQFQWSNYSSGIKCYKTAKADNPADGVYIPVVNPCDTAGCSDKCSVVDVQFAVCNCSSNPLLILDADEKTCVEKCTVENGGCDASAICTNPSTVGGDVECSCGAGEQFDSDGKTCIAADANDADKYCPTSTCWTYEMVEGTKKCVLKTGSAATSAGCDMYLHCTPDIMDFRWNNAKLLGTNTVHNNADSDCPIETSVGLVGTTAATGADKMWKHAPASCDSTVTREDVDGTDMIIITKSFEYQGDATGKNVGSTIYLEDAATVTIEVCCKFLATQSATSDDIAIEAGNQVEGKLDAVGSWDGSLKIEFTDNTYTTKKTDAAILGEMHYIKVSWTVGTSPLAQKVNWYVDDCTVSDVADANKKVDVIENQCFASVISAINTSTNMLSTSDFKFTFKSFSFNSAGNGSQKITCNINFCLKDNNECTTETDTSKLTCSSAEAEKWVKPN